MKKLNLFLCSKIRHITLIVILLTSLNLTMQSQNSSESINKFTFDLYKQISEDGKNLFFSPYSISTALAMTYIGAKENTEIEFQKVLYFGADKDELGKSLHSIVEQFEKDGEIYQLDNANSLWLQKNFSFQDDFLKTVSLYYDAGVKTVDFKSNPEKCREQINRWVEEKTHKKIKDLIPPKVITDLTRLVLANAIYFKAEWHEHFKQENSREDLFYLKDKEDAKVKTMFMFQKMRVNYYEDMEYQAIELPYKNRKLSMMVILPNEKMKIDDFEALLTYDNYINRVNQINYQTTEITIPKFTFTSDFNLTDYLINMGMTDAFGKQADFSGITGQKNLMIDKVFHKAFVEVNEEGTEAAAATAVLMMEKSAGPSSDFKVFTANRPFVFLIKDNATQTILFAGKVCNPNQK